jgi:hypothetical protein
MCAGPILDLILNLMAYRSSNGQPDPLAQAQQVTRYLEQIINIIPGDSIDAKWATNFYHEKKIEKQYENEFIEIVDQKLVLIAETSYEITETRPTALIHFWNNCLWPLYTLTFWWKGHRQILISFRSFLALDTPELQLALSRSTQIILLQNGKCVSALEFNLPKVNPAMWKLLDSTVPHESIRDKIAAKAWVEGCLYHIDRKTPGEKELEFGWARRLNEEIYKVLSFYKDQSLTEEFNREKEILFSSPYNEFFKDVAKSASIIYNTYKNKFWISHLSPIEEGMTISHSKLSEAPIHASYIRRLIECAWFSSSGTLRGQRITSLKLDGTAEELQLYSSLQSDCLKHYWERIPFDLPLYYKELFGVGSCPLNIKDFVLKAPLYQGDIEEGEEFVSNLLAEATSLKQWTIPFGAYVQIDIGTIKAVKVFEIGEDVACVLVDQSGHYLLVWVNPTLSQIIFTHMMDLAYWVGTRDAATKAVEFVTQRVESDALSSDDKESVSRFLVGIKILIAAIIRDFWVVEERQRVFGSAVITKKISRLRSDWGKRTIVYLPRVRYMVDIKNRVDELDLVKRRPHFVSGHLRKAMQASESQILLARRFGIIVPEGFTFVRPHKRGDKVQEKIYRSRSALQCIKALKGMDIGNSKDTWFTYELNVKNWLHANGFEVEHIAASRHGDGGVDIQAFKGDEHLLVQCKYWQKDRIGPNVIREMLGTLQTFPKGAGGVIITSTELTEGAKKMAIENGIQYIENADFAGGLKKKL